MHGHGTVVVSIPAGAAAYVSGNPNAASTGDNSVTYDNVGTVGFDLAVVPATEGKAALVTATRSNEPRARSSTMPRPTGPPRRPAATMRSRPAP